MNNVWIREIRTDQLFWPRQHMVLAVATVPVSNVILVMIAGLLP